MELANLLAGLRGSKERRLSPIGVKLGIECAQFIQLERIAQGLAIKAVVTAPYPSSRDDITATPSQFRQFVNNAIRGAGFSTRQVVTSMAPESTKVVLLNYSVKPNQRDEAAMLPHLKERLTGALSDWVIDYLPIRTQQKDSPERFALVAAAKRDVVIAHLELYRQMGLEVEAVEIGPIAIRRLVTFLRSPDNFDNFLIINIGENTSYLTVLWGRRLVMDRQIEFGRKNLIQALCSSLDIDSNHANYLLCTHGFRRQDRADEIADTTTDILKPIFLRLVEEINRALIYIASETRGGSVARCHLLGAMANWPEADTLLGSLLSIPAAKLDPFSGFVAGDSGLDLAALDRSSSMVIATGHALRGMASHAGI